MERLDQTYFNDLVNKARGGSSNAFAELFAAVSDRQYLYLTHMLGSKEAARDAMTGVFSQALSTIGSLQNAGLFMPWLCRIAFRYCTELSKTGMAPGLQAEPAGHTDGYSISQLMHLPLAEAQILMMYYGQNMSVAEIGDVLNIGNRTVKRFLSLGRKHLGRDGKLYVTGQTADRRQHRNLHLTSDQAEEILQKVFAVCELEPNSIALEALSSYAVYRKERFTLQRVILAAAFIVFLLLPLMFILPTYEVRATESGERGLPVYTVSVKSRLPVGRVTASLKNRSLPVYEVSAKEYTIEPTRNGTMTITVALRNMQWAKQEYEVTSVDATGPKLLGNETGEDTFLLRVKDDGIGVDYRAIFAVGESGERYEPLSADEENGILFSYPQEPWDIYIPDHIGNTLHLSISLK